MSRRSIDNDNNTKDELIIVMMTTNSNLRRECKLILMRKLNAYFKGNVIIGEFQIKAFKRESISR